MFLFLFFHEEETCSIIFVFIRVAPVIILVGVSGLASP